MSTLTIERCPETGICSIVKPGAGKVDLMPDEVEEIKAAGANAAKVKEILSDGNRTFAAGLEAGEVKQIIAALG